VECKRGSRPRLAMGVPEGVRERTDDIDAAVLLLDRKLNTELRLLECALDFRSGDCITP
jgi:hypothetical protein